MLAYIHIGMDKTGTTYLQSFCYEYRIKLKELGLNYPLGSSNNVFSHVDFAHAHGFGWSNYATDETSVNAGNCLFETDPDQTLLLSSEAFALDFSAVSLNRLKNWLNRLGYTEVKIIVYLRNQIDFFVGIFSESVKWGNKLVPESFYDVCRSRLFYKELLETWSEVFGRENCIVFNYDSCRGDLAGTFFSTMGCREQTAPLIESYVPDFNNASPPQLIIEMIRNISFQMDRSELYNFIVQAFARKTPKSLFSLAKMHVWELPERLLNDSAELDIHNADITAQYNCQTFKPVAAYINKYQAKVIKLEATEYDKLARLLLVDMAS